MALEIGQRFRYFCVFWVVVLILISKSECKGGGRSSGGGGRSSSGGHSSSHSSSHSTSHSSSGTSHSSSGGGYHPSYGSGSHPGSHTSHGGGSYSYGGSSGHFGSSDHSPGYSVGSGLGTGAISHSGYKPIGFDNVNQQAHNSLNGRPNYYGGTAGRPGIGFDHVNSQAGGHPTYQYHPYKPQTVVHPSGFVQYHPPTQLQYTAPAPATTIHHTSTHYVPVYQPTIIHTQSSSDHASSFLGGYLIGRVTSGDHTHAHVTNNYYNDNGGSNTNSYYTVHHYHQNPEKVPSRFSVPGDDLTECQTTTTDQLCVPNTNAFCLRNGTIMCTTPSVLTTPCEQNSTERCVYSRIPCTPNLACNVTSNQTYVDFYLPCIANVTYVNNRVFDSNYVTLGSYELCVTAIAHPRKLESPFGAVANFITELGKWHLDQLVDIHNLTSSNYISTTSNNNLIT